MDRDGRSRKDGSHGHVGGNARVQAARLDRPARGGSVAAIDGSVVGPFNQGKKSGSFSVFCAECGEVSCHVGVEAVRRNGDRSEKPFPTFGRIVWANVVVMSMLVVYDDVLVRHNSRTVQSRASVTSQSNMFQSNSFNTVFTGRAKVTVSPKHIARARPASATTRALLDEHPDVRVTLCVSVHPSPDP